MSDIYLPCISTIQTIAHHFIEELVNLDNYGKYFTIKIVVDDIQWMVFNQEGKTLLSIDIDNRSLNGISYSDDKEYIEAVARCFLSLTGYLSGMWDNYPIPVDRYNLRIVGFNSGYTVELSVQNTYTSLAYGECVFRYVTELSISPTSPGKVESFVRQFSIQPMIAESIGSVQALSRRFDISPRMTAEQPLPKIQTCTQ